MPTNEREWSVHHCKIATHRFEEIRRYFIHRLVCDEVFHSTVDSSIVLQKGSVRFLLEDCRPSDGQPFVEAITDVAIEVSDVDKQVERMVRAGAEIITPPNYVEDEDGRIRIAVVSSLVGSVVHTLIEKNNYIGSFLPNFKASSVVNSQQAIHLDHLAFACHKDKSDDLLRWFELCFGMRRFQVSSTEEGNDGFIVEHGDSGMRLKALNYWRCMETGVQKKNRCGRDIKFVVVEPLSYAGPNQVTTFLRENEGPGVQHIAFLTEDILGEADRMRTSGTQFMTPPSTYYDAVTAHRSSSFHNLDLQAIKDASVLIDVEEADDANDKDKILLQIFTKPVFERDTFFLELIQRNRADGFGAANIKALWKAVDMYMDSKRT